MFWKDPDGSVAADLTESADLFRRAGDPDGEALARISLALALLAGSEPDTEHARTVMERSLALFRGSGNVWGESMALVLLGRVAFLQKHLDEARGHFEESLRLTQRTGDVVGERIASYHLGWARLFDGDLAEARDRLRAEHDGSRWSWATRRDWRTASKAWWPSRRSPATRNVPAGSRAPPGSCANAAACTTARRSRSTSTTSTSSPRPGSGTRVEAAIEAGRELTLEQAVAEALAEPVQAAPVAPRD